MHEAGTGSGLVLKAALAAWHHGQMNEFVDALSISSHINLNSIKNESRVDAPLKQIPYHSPKRHDSQSRLDVPLKQCQINVDRLFVSYPSCVLQESSQPRPRYIRLRLLCVCYYSSRAKMVDGHGMKASKLVTDPVDQTCLQILTGCPYESATRSTT